MVGHVHCGVVGIALSREVKEAVLVRLEDHSRPTAPEDRASHRQFLISLLELPPVVVSVDPFLLVIWV